MKAFRRLQPFMITALMLVRFRYNTIVNSLSGGVDNEIR